MFVEMLHLIHPERRRTRHKFWWVLMMYVFFLLVADCELNGIHVDRLFVVKQRMMLGFIATHSHHMLLFYFFISYFWFLFNFFNQATGCTSQHLWCLSQARIKWEGCGRKGIWRKNGGMMEVGHWLIWMEWRLFRWYLPLHRKVQMKISSGTVSPGWSWKGPGKGS